MKKPPLKFMRNEYIEVVTSQRLREYESKANTTLKLPIPIELIIEQVFDLNILWDTIEEQPGELILGGLQAKNRTILLNDKHLKLFDDKPGLLRSTLGHETGHWDIDTDKADLEAPSLFSEQTDERIVHRHASKTNELIEVLLTLAWQNDKVYRTYKMLTAGQDTPEQKSAVDRYQSALLMPAWLMKEAVTRYDVTEWRELYQLANEAQVNISNLVTRLRRLDLIFIPSGSKRIYRNKDEYTGQGTLF